MEFDFARQASPKGSELFSLSPLVQTGMIGRTARSNGHNCVRSPLAGAFYPLGIDPVMHRSTVRGWAPDTPKCAHRTSGRVVQHNPQRFIQEQGRSWVLVGGIIPQRLPSRMKSTAPQNERIATLARAIITKDRRDLSKEIEALGDDDRDKLLDLVGIAGRQSAHVVRKSRITAPKR